MCKISKFLVVCAFVFALSSYGYAGTFTTIDWINDSSLPIDSTFTYTHAIDFAEDDGTVVINGVTITQYGVPGGWGNADPYEGTDSVTGNSWVIQTNNSRGPLAATGPTGENSEILITSICHAGEDNFITIDGLQPGTNYIFTWYSPIWLDTVVRTGTLDGSDDGLNYRTYSTT